MELELRSQRIWDWRIAVYLFLGGLGAGCYLVGVLFDLFSSGYTIIVKVGVLLGTPIVLIGTFFLLADMGRANQAFRAVFRPSTSWISRGTIILGIFIILGTIHIAFWIWPFDWMMEGIVLRKTLGVINGFFALLTILYTGLLLGAFRSIPFWCSPLLPVLFLTSGLSTALMVIGLGTVIWNLTVPSIEHSSLAVLTTFETPLILMEGMVVFFYMQGSHLLDASRAAVHKVIRGDLAATFWILFVLLGLVLPFTMSVIEQVSDSGSTQTSYMLFTFKAVLGLVGGYFLRYLIVKAGIKVSLDVAGVIVLPYSET